MVNKFPKVYCKVVKRAEIEQFCAFYTRLENQLQSGFRESSITSERGGMLQLRVN